MTRFVPSYYASPSATAQRPEAVVSRRRVESGLDASRPLAGMLLAAVVAALLVVADRLIDTWSNGNLLVVWVASWTVVFATLALLASSLRQAANAAALMLSQWNRARLQRRTEAAMWQHAQGDYRVLAEIQMARLRNER